MSQRVPNCDVDDNNNIPTTTKIPLLPNFNFISHEVPMLGYQAAELPCKKGQPSTYKGSHGNLTSTWDKPRTSGGTLESIVSQHVSENRYKLVTMDALVPCSEQPGTQKAVVSERLDACGKSRFPRVVAQEEVEKRAGVVARGTRGTTTLELGGCKDWSVSGSETCRRELSVTFNSATKGSPENTTCSGKQCTGTTTNDDRDSISHRISQGEVPDEDYKATKVDRSSGSNKRIKANSVVHKQSERRRRDKINQRMKELQKLVPNSSKTDKASMLDEVIQYMKQLQAQVQMMNWMKMYTSMMLPITMQQQQQQQLKMSMMMAQMGMGMGMSKDMVMNMNSMNIPGFPPMLPFPSFMPMAPCGDQLQGTPEKSVTMDAYSTMASLYQQLFHPPASSSKN
ncbi:hypothetical protein JHK85_006400 [Glycine max]|nr:hypothetical protein JHK85_006400 [Glycine max]